MGSSAVVSTGGSNRCESSVDDRLGLVTAADQDARFGRGDRVGAELRAWIIAVTLGYCR